MAQKIIYFAHLPACHYFVHRPGFQVSKSQATCEKSDWLTNLEYAARHHTTRAFPIYKHEKTYAELNSEHILLLRSNQSGE